MSQISVERISKLYRVTEVEREAKDLFGRLGQTVLAPIRNLHRLRTLDRFEDETDESVVWALREVSFNVSRGEVIGIIGRNGAGKSTLLKILSRITRPTKGRVTMQGRLSSLLEVGTGFHPELSGRENIFLNGAIIGMRSAEIRRKLDAIVEFSGVGRFLDTPIKRYSSGMKVRLAFAVAAHLEPDILVIDEVLAVGDTEFQQKCLGTMASLGESGRTVLFVSHNLAAVQSLCRRGLVLQAGALKFDGPVDGALDYYLDNIASAGRPAGSPLPASNGVVLGQISFTGGAASADGLLRSGEAARLAISLQGSLREQSPILLVWLSGTFGERLMLVSSRLSGVALRPFSRSMRALIDIDPFMVMPGHYHLNVALVGRSGERLAAWENHALIEVHPSRRAAALTLPSVADRGVVYAPAEWCVQVDDE